MEKVYQFPQQSAGIMKTLRSEDNFCDAVLETDDKKTFKVHRCILTAATNYFKGMFSRNFKEGNNEGRPIPIHEISSVGFEAVLDCLYTGELKLDMETVYDTLEVAHLFDLKNLIQACDGYLVENIDSTTFFKILEHAEKFDLKAAEEATETFMLDNFIELSKKKEFLDISLDALCKYLKDDRFKDEEIELFKAAKRWIECKAERLECLVTVMKCINFNVIPTNALADEVMVVQYMRSSEECDQMIRNAIKYHDDVFTQPLVPTPVWRGQQKLLIVDPFADNAEIQKYDLDAVCDDDSSIDQGISGVLPTGVKIAPGSMTLATINNFVYLFGTDSSTLMPVSKRSKVNNKLWIDLAPIPQATIGSTGAVVGDNVIIVGGVLLPHRIYGDASHYTNSSWCYSVSENKWKKIAPFPCGIAYPSPCSKNSLLYVAGGCMRIADAVQVSNKLYAYDIRGDIWLPKAEMHHARSQATLQADDNALFVFGGCTFTGGSSEVSVPSIEMYDISQNQWTILNQSGFPYDSSASFVHQGNFFLVGGWHTTEGKKSDSIYKFDVETRSIRRLKKIGDGHHRHSVALLKMQ